MGMVVVAIDCRRTSQHHYSQKSIGRAFLHVSFVSIGNIFRHALIAYRPAHWNTSTISANYRGFLPDDCVQDLYDFEGCITCLHKQLAIVDGLLVGRSDQVAHL
jgi:hypothetical protein